MAATTTKYMRIGDILVRQGVMTEVQRDSVLSEQEVSGRPFGDLAERMYGISPREVERAWADQLADMADVIDPRESAADPHALRMITRRQARQFGVVPIKFDGSVLVVCATKESVARAVRFLGWRIGVVCHVVLAEAEPLREAIEQFYPPPS